MRNWGVIVGISLAETIVAAVGIAGHVRGPGYWLTIVGFFLLLCVIGWLVLNYKGIR